MSKLTQLMLAEKSIKVTLYSGADDPDLPSNIKGLPLNIRSRWVNNYNWAVMDTQSDKAAKEQADSYTTISVEDLATITASKEHAPEVASAVAATVASVSSVPSASGQVHTGVQAPSLSLVDRFKAFFRPDDPPPPTPAPTPTSMFQVYKGADGRTRVLTVYSNQFKDSHKQIVSEAAHQEYAQATDAGLAPYPDLHLWHGGPDTKWGTIETVSVVDGFAVAGGVVDPGKEHVALKLKEMADKGELAVSYGFLGLLGPDEVYHAYRAFEISPLPVGSEANPWFTLMDFKENGMAFSAKKKEWLKNGFGMTDEGIAAAEKSFEAMGTALKAAGIEYKEGEGETAPTPPAPAPTPPAPTPDPAPGPTPPAAEATIMPQIAAMAKAMEGMALGITALTTEVKAMKEATPAVTAQAADDLVLARIAGSPGFSPTRDPGNVVAALKDNNEDDYLARAFGNVLPGLVGAGSGGTTVQVVPPAANGEVK